MDNSAWSFEPGFAVESGPARLTLACFLELAERLAPGIPRNALASVIGYENFQNGPLGAWFRGTCEPVSQNAIKLRCALELLGYRLLETEPMVPEIKVVAAHVGYGLCSCEELARLLDMSKAQVDCILRGHSYRKSTLELPRSSAEREKVELIRLYLQDHVQDTRELREKLLKQLRDIPGIHGALARAAPPTVTSPSAASANGRVVETPLEMANHSALLQSFAHMVKAMAPMAELLAGDSFSVEEREELRSLAGQFGIFRLKNDLIRLCGEQARRMLNQRGENNG